MLGLAFSIGRDRFALRCADVVEVVPRVNLRDIPHAPRSVAGMFTYRGAVVPVVDLCQLLWQTPAADRMSTRIIVVRHAKTKLVGLLAERVTEAVNLDPARATASGIAVDDAPYLGEVYFDDAGMIQLLRLDEIVGGAIGRMLSSDEGVR